MGISIGLVDRRGWMGEALLALFLLVSGGAGLAIATDSTLWQRFFEQTVHALSLGKVARQKGAVRFRASGSIVWRDVSFFQSVAGGDTVFTGYDGSALLELGKEVAIEMGPNSLILVQGPSAASGEESTWGQWLAPFFGKGESQPLVQIQEGGARIRLSGQSGVRVRAGGKDLKITLAEGGGGVASTNSAGNSTRDSTREVEVQIEKGASGVPEGLKILAQKNASVEISEVRVSDGKLALSQSSATPLLSAAPLFPAEGETFFASVPAASGSASASPELMTLPLSWKWKSEGEDPQDVRLEVEGPSSLNQPLSVDALKAGKTEVSVKKGSYRWRLSSKKAGVTPWRSVRVAGLDAPKPIGPVEGAVVLRDKASTAVNLTWSALETGLRSEVEIVDSGGARKVIPGGREGARLELAAGEYSWRIRSLSATSGSSEWSAPSKFSISEGEVAQRAISTLLTSKLPKVEALPVATPEPSPAPSPTPLPVPVKPKSAAKKLDLPLDVVRVLPKAKFSAATNRIEILPSFAINSVSASTRLKSDADLDKMQVVLRWSPIKSVEHYEVVVFDSGENKILDEKVEQPMLLLTLKSLSQTEYSYEVAAVLKSGKRIQAPRVPIRIELVPPVIKLPEPGSVHSRGKSVLITWESTVLTKNYMIQISRDPFFKTERIDEEKTLGRNFYVYTPAEPGKWYWRARSISEKVQSGWSSVGVFQVDGNAAQEPAPGSVAPAPSSGEVQYAD